MSDHTNIEWADATWNPVVGCTKVSPGCDHCYAIRTAHRMQANPNDAVASAYEGTEANGEWTGRVNLLDHRLAQPMRWAKPRRIFVNAQSDLFHDGVTDEFIAQVFAVMALTPRHTYQVLTKRHARMRSLLNSERFKDLVAIAMAGPLNPRPKDRLDLTWPRPNVWMGVSVEDQKRADLRVPALLETPAAVRFLSCEPLLGPVRIAPADGIDWVIVGGESGPDARPMHPGWARHLRDQCQGAGIPFFFKQRGEWSWSEPGEFRMPAKPYSSRVAVMHPAGMTALTHNNPFDPFGQGHPDWATRVERVGKRRAGRLLDGRTWDEYPEVTA